jgi:hypothetical protein
LFPEGGVAGAGPGDGTLIGDSGSLGAISAPASFTALKVVPGGVSGGRLSMTRLVWFTTIIVTIEIATITAGFRSTIAILINVLSRAEFHFRGCIRTRIANRVAALATKRGKSVDFIGYWQRHVAG